ncbi:MAG: DHH family phosphoesterase [Deltaproteobacteria bacterium]|nr:DHH family phosphoesterase [Deltaproteobacteria bacterium]
MRLAAMSGAEGEREGGVPPSRPWGPLCEVVGGARRLVVFLHDNPDPDAIASGWILQRVAQHLGVRSRVVYGGHLGRAENLAMVRLLRIPLTRLTKGTFQPRAGDRFALVDTQPGSANNSFPRKWRAHIVIDHHPRRRVSAADFVDIRPGTGTCTTLLLDLARTCGLPLDARLATAAAYAIVSETQDLKRESQREDRAALQELMPLVRLATLGRIRHPPRPREYYLAVAQAMRNVQLGRNTCVCHVGPVPAPESVAELADFLAGMERVTWCLVTGLHAGTMVLSIRTTNARGHAHRVMRRTVGSGGTGGGHRTMAGGQHPCADETEYRRLCAAMTERFLASVPHRAEVRLRPLVCEPAPPDGTKPALPPTACPPAEDVP